MNARSVCTDIQGCAYVTGSFSGSRIVFGTDTLFNADQNSSSPMADFFLVKYDSLGQVIWARSAGSKGYYEGMCITAGQGGVFYVAGHFAGSLQLGSITVTTSANNNTNMFVAKYDTSGQVLWATGVNSAAWSFPDAITADDRENIYITGNFGGPLTLGNISLNSSSEHIFLIKMNSMGIPLWGKSMGTDANDKGTGLAVSASGDVYLGGSFYDSLSIGNGPVSTATGCDLFTAKFSSGGSPLWVRAFGGAGFDYLTSICSDQDGNVYLTGSFTSSFLAFGTASLSRVSTQDIFLARLDANGQPVWANAYGAGCSAAAEEVVCDEAGDVYLTGTFNSQQISFGSVTLTNGNNVAGFSMFVSKVDGKGQADWARNVKSSHDYEAGQSLAVDVFGNVFTTGFYYSSWVAFDADTVLSPGGGYAAYLGRIGDNVVNRTQITTAIGQTSRAVNMTIFPNPASHVFFVTTAGEQAERLAVYNSEGRLMMSRATPGTTFSVDVAGLPAGIYFLKICSPGSITTQKLVVDN